jgi:hypothetical protein
VDKNLKTLNLNDNHIQYIRVLAELDLRSLKELKLSTSIVIAGNNKIDNISSLAEAKWPKLALLNLASNCFTSIEAVTSMPFPALVELVLGTRSLIQIKTNLTASNLSVEPGFLASSIFDWVPLIAIQPMSRF